MVLSWVSWLQKIISVIIFGEAFALFTGMFIIQRRKAAWIDKKNTLLLITDMLAAILLFAVENRIIVLIVLVFLLISHAFRAVEPFFRVKVPFCFNRPLLIVNGIKLLVLLALLLCAIF